MKAFIIVATSIALFGCGSTGESRNLEQTAAELENEARQNIPEASKASHYPGDGTDLADEILAKQRAAEKKQN